MELGRNGEENGLTELANWETQDAIHPAVCPGNC